MKSLYELMKGKVLQEETVLEEDDNIEWTDEDFEDFEDEEDDDIPFNPSELENEVINFTWEDILDMYEPDELEVEDEGEEIEESLSVAQRMRKRMVMKRNKKRLAVARKVKLRRASSQGVLKQRAVRKARQMVTKRLLRGRDKSKMSSSEKSAVERRVKRMKNIVQRTAKRLTPTMRKIERQRLSNR